MSCGHAVDVAEELDQAAVLSSVHARGKIAKRARSRSMDEHDDDLASEVIEGEEIESDAFEPEDDEDEDEARSADNSDDSEQDAPTEDDSEI
jgi:hypothetical protein